MTTTSTPATAESAVESFPIFERLLRERVRSGRSVEFERWSADARQRLAAHAEANPNPKVRKDVEKLVRAYELAGGLLDQLEALARRPAARTGA